MVKTPVFVLLAIAALLWRAGAEAACPPKQTRDCVINLDAVPQISREIVATERVAPKGKAAPKTDTKTPYTGPTIGVTPTVRMYPQVGYHWSFD
ncbi:MAG: hypothetical protein JO162_04600 [Alphaproteobacteria bacterium]|nr:hypothetical protein [Alphaproteobacteria bacterium]